MSRHEAQLKRIKAKIAELKIEREKAISQENSRQFATMSDEELKAWFDKELEKSPIRFPPEWEKLSDRQLLIAWNLISFGSLPLEDACRHAIRA